MFTLYSRKNTGSAAVEALLSILGVAFKNIDVVKNTGCQSARLVLRYQSARRDTNTTIA